ncbi:MAG: cohesin domain-containing protein [Pseudomonadota bacterium]
MMIRQKLTLSDKYLYKKALWHTWVIFSLILAYPIILQAAPQIKIQAESIQYVGGEFRVDIMIEGVNNLYGIAMDLNYDSESIEVIDADSSKEGIQFKTTEGQLINNNGTQVSLLKLALEDDIPGKLVIGLSRSGEVTGADSSSETVLFSIYFRSKKSGTSQLTSANQGLKDDSNQDIIDSTWGELALNVGEYDWTGDVNQNRLINLEDMTLVLKALSGKTEESISVNADVNQNEKIGIEEAIKVLQTESK